MKMTPTWMQCLFQLRLAPTTTTTTTKMSVLDDDGDAMLFFMEMRKMSVLDDDVDATGPLHILLGADFAVTLQLASASAGLTIFVSYFFNRKERCPD